MSSSRAIVNKYLAIGSITAFPTPAAVSGDMSADITGPITVLDKIDQVCYQVTWTSSNAIGVISVQGSADGVTFNDITFNPALTQPASNNGSYLINLALIPFMYVRLKYTRTSGSGTLVVYLNAKGN